MKILVTGTRSGLGKYIHEKLGGIGLTRQNSDEILRKLKVEGVDVIIHCAFNPRSDFSLDSFADYIGDNVLLTHRLAEIPHQKFIYVSSIDVYAGSSNQVHSENDVIHADPITGIYGMTKLASESIVKRYGRNHLILRGVGFLGAHARKNSCRKIIEDNPCELTLAADSIFNYVRHADVLNFIRYALDNNLKNEIFNLASSANITLSEIAELFKKKVKFGSFRYDVGHISNEKASSLMPSLRQTTRDAILQFAEHDLGKKPLPMRVKQ